MEYENTVICAARKIDLNSVQVSVWILFGVGTSSIVTAQLQLQLNMSWCNLNLTLYNNSAPAQPPSTAKSKYVCQWLKYGYIIFS